MTCAACDAIAGLLGERAAGATICPSEVARRIATGGDWRAAMPTVHAAVDRLVAEGAVHLSWQGRPLVKREGPYRISVAGSAPISRKA